MEDIHVGSCIIGKKRPLTLISGPCVIESREHTLLCAERLVEICAHKDVQLIFKASYDKANRTSFSSFRGPGLEEGLDILQEVKETFHISVLSDVHEPQQAAPASRVLDVLQLPAFLCRQTDLTIAIAQTGKPVLVKKGQFMAPWDMKNIVEKIHSTGNKQVLLCDRGVSFGYNNLVCDMRSLAIMQQFAPVVFDASHSVQLPGSLGKETGGQREFIPLLSRAAVAAGIQALFLETHPTPQTALSDAASVFPLSDLGALLEKLLAIHALVREDT